MSARQNGQAYYDFAQSITVAGAGQATSKFFTANGLYDPDISGTGHQPIGFDQMMLMYNQYTVTSSSIVCRFTCDGVPAVVGIYLSPDTTAITDPIRLMENGLITTALVDAASASSGTGQRQVEVKLNCDVARYFGRPRGRTLLNDVDLQGTAASNPAEQVYFGVVCWAGRQSLDTPTVYFDVLLKYNTVYFEPRKLTVS